MSKRAGGASALKETVVMPHGASEVLNSEHDDHDNRDGGDDGDVGQRQGHQH